MLEKNIKNIKKQFKDNGIFYTNKTLALKLKSYINIEIKEVYDPTCGQGNLLNVFDDNVKKYGQEINPNELEKCKKTLNNFIGYAGDTLTSPMFINKKFDCIVANYPFSVKWNPKKSEIFKDCEVIPPPSRADYAFIMHIVHCLSDSGVAITLNFPGVLYRGNKEGKIRKWLVDKNYIDEIIAIEGGHFIDTNIETVIIIFRKNKKTNNIKFTDNKNGKSYTASLNEVIDNEYILSVSRYIIEEVEKEKIDPKKLQNNARLFFIEKMKKDILFDKKVCEIEGWNHQEYLIILKKEIEKIIAGTNK